MFSKSTHTQDPEKEDSRPSDAARGWNETDADATATPHSSTGMPARVSQSLMERLPESGLELTAENLPVLNAFNEFLEVERRASRRRSRGLFWLFLMLFVASLTAAVMVGWGIVQHMQSELDAERELADIERQRIAGDISMVAAGASDELNSQLAVRDRAVRYTYRTLADHIDGQTNRMGQLLETMALMEQEIHDLEDALREVTRRMASAPPPAMVADDTNIDPQLEAQIEQDFAELRRRARLRQEALAQDPDGDITTEPSPPQDAEDTAASSPLTIRTPEGGAVPWRL